SVSVPHVGSGVSQTLRARNVDAANEKEAWPDGNEVGGPSFGRGRPTIRLSPLVASPVSAKLSAATSNDSARSPSIHFQPASPADPTASAPRTTSPDFVELPVIEWLDERSRESSSSCG